MFRRTFSSSLPQLAQKTALFDLHIAQKAKMVEFAGWQMPLMYAGHLAEHFWTRENSSVFDVGHMMQTRWTGADAKHLLASLCPASLDTLTKGDSTLSVFTNTKGGIIDDCVVNCDDGGFYVVSNAGCAQKDLAHIRAHLDAFTKQGKQVKVDVLDLSLVALQGIY